MLHFNLVKDPALIQREFKICEKFQKGYAHKNLFQDRKMSLK